MSGTKKRMKPTECDHENGDFGKKTKTSSAKADCGSNADKPGVNDRHQARFDKIVSQLSLGKDTHRIVIDESRIAGAGLGVFAAMALKKGAPITQYSGLFRAHDECAKLIKDDPDNATHMRTQFAMRSAIDGLFLPDGTPITDARTQLADHGVGAMLNHSDTPNCEFDRVDNAEQHAAMEAFLDGGPSNFLPENRVTFIRAIADIAKGEELTVSYGVQYWKRTAKKAAGGKK